MSDNAVFREKMMEEIVIYFYHLHMDTYNVRLFSTILREAKDPAQAYLNPQPSIALHGTAATYACGVSLTPTRPAAPMLTLAPI